MKKCDVLIIGAGLLGCFAARAISAYELNTIVLESREDVCTGISRANTGIIYAGYDTKPHTLKTELCVKANKNFESLCKELDVPFKKCGSLMIACSNRAESVLMKKYKNGIENGVEGLELLSSEEVLKLEPNLTKDVTLGLYAKSTCTVDPWALGIAAYENAKANKVSFFFNSSVTEIKRTDDAFIVKTGNEAYLAKAVINCAGLSSDMVRELVEKPSVRIVPSAADYYVLDTTANGFINHVIFHEPEEKGKGLTLIPTVDGNILVGPTEHDVDEEGYAPTSIEGLKFLKDLCKEIVPGLDLNQTIRSFGSKRPNPYYVHEENGEYVREDKGISNFTILEENGLFSLIGIKTPGLTCSNELGSHIASLVISYLGDVKENKNFTPHRNGITDPRSLSDKERNELIKSEPAYGHIICRCKGVSEGEIKEAINRGASTVDGVKRRVGSGMGRCQGGYCMQYIMEMLAKAYKTPVESVTKNGAGSEVLL